MILNIVHILEILVYIGLYIDQNGTEHESITDLSRDFKYYYLVFKPNGYERFSRIHVNFGLDIFEASKTSEI